MSLPPGWSEVALSEVVERLVDGSHNPPKAAAAGRPMLSARNIENGRIVFDDYRLIPESDFEREHARTRVAPGDVLLTIVGALGRAAVVPEIEPFTLQRSVAVLKPRALEPAFLVAQLQAPAIQEWIQANAKGTAQRGIYLGVLGELQVRVAPLAEQKRIVAKIEELTARSGRAKDALDAVPPLLEQLRRSILAAAFRGDLTSDWRAKNPSVEPADKLIARIRAERRARWEAAELAKLIAKGKRPTDDRWKARYCEPEKGGRDEAGELPNSWAWSSLGELFEVGVGATPSRAEASYWGGDVPWVSSGEVAFCRISSTRERITEKGLANTSTDVHPVGTVLIGMIGEGKTRGQAAILDVPACNNQNSAAIRVSETPVPPEYVYEYLALVYEQTRRVGSGNNQQALNKSRVQALSIPVAPVNEQRELVRRLGLWLERADAVEAEVNDGLERVAALDQALLAKAFRGELVPQDPSDEPASVLLERIRATRSSAEAGARSRRRSRKVEDVVETTDDRDDDDGSDAPAPPLRTGPDRNAIKGTSDLDQEAVLDEVFAALWTQGPLEKDDAIRRVAAHLREAGYVEFQRLRSDGPLYAQFLGFIEAAVKAGRLDRPRRGHVRACKADANTFTADDWRLALVASLGTDPVDREDAIRAAAEWARDNLGLEFARLRSDGQIVQGLRSAMNSGIRRGEITRHDTSRISRAAGNGHSPRPLDRDSGPRSRGSRGTSEVRDV